MAEIVDIRRSLEPNAIANAMASITRLELNQARELAEDLANEEDIGLWAQKNIHFHSIFHRATRTVRLGVILQGLEEAGGVFVAQAQRIHPDIRQRAVAEHLELLQAYEAKDAGRALEIQIGHLNLPLEGAVLNESHRR
jgi:DNA-binding GntR family transcriptional regulator